MICVMSLCGCAALQDTFSAIGGVFSGNTKREQNTYNLESKREYRNGRYLDKVHLKEEEQEILRRLYCPDGTKNAMTSDDETAKKLCRD